MSCRGRCAGGIRGRILKGEQKKFRWFQRFFEGHFDGMQREGVDRSEGGKDVVESGLKTELSGIFDGGRMGCGVL